MKKLRPLTFRPRLLPAVIVAATVLLGMKVSDIVFGDTGAISIARAQTPGSESKPVPVPAAPSSAVPQPASGQKIADATAIPVATGTATANAATGDTSRDPALLSPSEIDVLQQLSQRRAALDKRASQIDQGDVLMQAAEKRVDEKIAKLQALQAGIDAATKKQDEVADARAQSLVKIYETMKPGDAARIFEQLDMPVLLSVLEHMKEAKAAPILAAMDPMKAKTVTMALADQKAPASPPAPPPQTP